MSCDHLDRSVSVAAAVVVTISSVIFFPGCGRSGLDTIAVKGRVTYEGEPLVGGLVRFYAVDRAQGRSAKARIAPDGTFVVKTLSNTSGLVPGEYKVAVLLQKLPEHNPTPEQLTAAEANKMELPERFFNPETSGLRFTLEPGEGAQTYNIDLRN